MYTKILVPLDGSPAAEQALPHAAAHATAFHASVVLLRVVPPPAAPGVVAPGTAAMVHPAGIVDDTPQAAERLAASQYVRSAADALAARGITATTDQQDGEPTEAVLRRARELGADMIVMTTHGRGGLSRLLFGSVADSVLRAAPCPVLVVRVHA